MFAKVCGLTAVETVDVAVSAGADAIGVVMHQGSPRNVDEDTAHRIVDAARGRVDTVLVTGDLPAAEAARIAQRLGVDVLQLHGAYTQDDFADALAIFPRLWRATSLKHDPPLEVGAYGEQVLLLDAPKPGSGEQWDYTALAERNLTGDWLLAGGLTPDNVAQAIAQADPWGVDVSSGVESSPGVKDDAAIRAFLTAVRAASE